MSGGKWLEKVRAGLREDLAQVEAEIPDLFVDVLLEREKLAGAVVRAWNRRKEVSESFLKTE